MKTRPRDKPSLLDYANLERLIFLVDGIFAITLTLLVLELRPPETDPAHLAEGLREMLPRLAIYVIAFYTIANHWVVHQRAFRHITGLDTTMLWLTLAGLLFITLMPASTAIMGRYPGEKLALACFSANSFLQALASWLFWAYVVRRRDQVTSQTDPDLLKISAQVWLFICLGWLVSFLLSFIYVNGAYVSWVLFPNLAAQWARYRRRHLHGA
jgi:uncharacterized membrane protein